MGHCTARRSVQHSCLYCRAAPHHSGTAIPDFGSMAAFRIAALCLLMFAPAAAALKHSGALRAKAPGDAMESATDFLLDAQMQVRQMDDLTAEVETLAASVAAGGDKARPGGLAVSQVGGLFASCGDCEGGLWRALSN